MLWGLALATFELGPKTIEPLRQIYCYENIPTRNLLNQFSSWNDILTWDLSANTRESGTANLSFIKGDWQMTTTIMTSAWHWVRTMRVTCWTTYSSWTFWFGYWVSAIKWGALTTTDWVKLTLLKIMDLDIVTAFIFFAIVTRKIQ